MWLWVHMLSVRHSYNVIVDDWTHHTFYHILLLYHNVTIQIRSPADVEGVDGIILPGGVDSIFDHRDIDHF